MHHRKGRSPGQRFRIEHYLPFLEKQGFEIIFSNILSEKDDITFYSKGKYFGKLKIVIKSFFHRLKDIKIAKSCDYVFVYREAFMLGTTYFEKRFSKSGAKLIFDFDDAIWLNDTSAGNQNVSWLKRPSKTAKICKYSHFVITGNRYLADYALKYNSNVNVIPTAIDMNYHVRNNISKREKICIGWTGTQTTLKHFESAISALKKVKEKYGDKVYFKIVADVDEWENELGIKPVKWNKENEIKELEEFDIGIMPLPDNEWTRGKCGFKGLQCMSMGIPVVMSSVGINNEIIRHGKNGFLCNSEEEWITSLSSIIESPELREKIGEIGRHTVLNNYSVQAWKNQVLMIFSGK